VFINGGPDLILRLKNLSFKMCVFTVVRYVRIEGYGLRVFSYIIISVEHCYTLGNILAVSSLKYFS